MQLELNPTVQEIQISGIRRFSNLVAKVPGALSLTIGQPDFTTPEHVKAAGKHAIDQNQTGYTSNAGLPDLREAAAGFLQRYGLSYDGNREVIVTSGSTEGLAIAFQTILRPGDEVILPGPVYPGYEPLIRFCGATVKYVDTTGSAFKLTAKLLKAAISEKTRCVVIPYPANPTGAVLNQEELGDIAQALKDQPVFVLSDEVYSELVYGAVRHQSIAQFPGMRDKTIVLNGLSKSHSMTGWRIGFTFAPEWITTQMLKVHQYYTSCASSISQHAAIAALTEGSNDAFSMREEYYKRGSYLFQRLASMGLQCQQPDGAFYLFPSIAELGLTSQDFAIRLLHEAKVAVVPGDAFSSYGEGFVRISYAVSMENLEEACRRMDTFVASLRSSNAAH